MRRLNRRLAAASIGRRVSIRTLGVPISSVRGLTGIGIRSRSLVRRRRRTLPAILPRRIRGRLRRCLRLYRLRWLGGSQCFRLYGLRCSDRLGLTSWSSMGSFLRYMGVFLVFIRELIHRIRHRFIISFPKQWPFKSDSLSLLRLSVVCQTCVKKM